MSEDIKQRLLSSAINSASADNQYGPSLPSIVDKCQGTSHYRDSNTSAISTVCTSAARPPLQWASIVTGIQPSAAAGAAPTQSGVIF
jgi:hypothetical protein